MGQTDNTNSNNNENNNMQQNVSQNSSERAPLLYPVVPQQFAQQQQPVVYYTYMPTNGPQYGQPQYVPAQYNANNYPQPGFIPQPQQPTVPAAGCCNNDDLGGCSSKIWGGVLGFFFPIISLFALCCSRRLRFKHGVLLGHAIHYGLCLALFLILSILWVSVVVPYTCNNINACDNDVMNGTNSYYWQPFLTACNQTHYSSNSSHHHHQEENSSYFRAPNGTCPIYDHSTPGPQTPECADCVCYYRRSACSIADAAHTSFWATTAVSLVFTVIFARWGSYYSRLIRCRSSSSTPRCH